ncbi:MAG: hypothetical protein ACI307_05940 [Sodaliphilus sp.]
MAGIAAPLHATLDTHDAPLFASGAVFFSAKPTFCSLPSHHPTQLHPSKPHQIKQPLSKLPLNERAVCGGQIFWGLRGGEMDKNDYLCVRKSATIV